MSKTATATSNGKNDTTSPQIEASEDIESDVKPSDKPANPFMRAVTPEMILSPYPLDFADGMNSFDFAVEKVNRGFLRKAKFSDEETWIDFAREAYARYKVEAAQEKRIKVSKWADELKADPELLNFLNEEMAVDRKERAVIA